MSNWTTTSTLTLGCVLVLYLARRALASKNAHPFPPGPPGVPWVGNVIGINPNAPWITYAEWAKTYGDIVYSRLLGRDVILISSEKIAKDLFEKRSRNYSDRPRLISNDMYGMGFNSGLMPYGNRWRMHRRFFHQTFRFDAAPRFLPLQHRKACHLIQRLLATPEQFDAHLFEYTTSVILNSTYNYDPPSRKDEIVELVANILNVVVPATRPDVSIVVSTFPFLLHFPSWLPGMSFKKTMTMARESMKQYLERPFEYSLRRVSMPGSSVAPCMVHDGVQHMEGKESSPEEPWMEVLKEAAGTMFLVASETSHAVLLSFFLMMVLNQDAQEKAQAQIDAVVGNTRLPTFEDRPLLPFVDAIFRETLRHSPVVPLSVPHAAVDDDVYEGFYIRKGSILLANLWSIAHDESRFTNPYAFIPERFLNDDGSLKPNDIEHIAFGFGRRICAGRHFADASVWSVIVKVLAMFKILKPLDENGVEITVEPKFSTGLVIHPLPFKCRIVPRFPGMNAQKLEALIAASSI